VGGVGVGGVVWFGGGGGVWGVWGGGVFSVGGGGFWRAGEGGGGCVGFVCGGVWVVFFVFFCASPRLWLPATIAPAQNFLLQNAVRGMQQASEEKLHPGGFVTLKSASLNGFLSPG